MSKDQDLELDMSMEEYQLSLRDPAGYARNVNGECPYCFRKFTGDPEVHFDTYHSDITDWEQ